jgi:hypothetical protein
MSYNEEIARLTTFNKKLLEEIGGLSRDNTALRQLFNEAFGGHRALAVKERIDALMIENLNLRKGETEAQKRSRKAGEQAQKSKTLRILRKYRDVHTEVGNEDKARLLDALIEEIKA